MNGHQQNDKDISKLFALLRTQLQAKEKELLQLQRADPCLLVPDFDQIDVLLDAIDSLQLCTEEGSFVFASTSIHDNTTFPTSTCSTGFNSIKTLPSTTWLSPLNFTKQPYEPRSSMFSHLLSLPMKAYLASSVVRTPERQKTSFSRLPTINHLLCMPIDAFKPSSGGLNRIQNLQTKVVSNTKTMESILNSNTIYSKEFWLRDIRNMSSV